MGRRTALLCAGVLTFAVAACGGGGGGGDEEAFCDALDDLSSAIADGDLGDDGGLDDAVDTAADLRENASDDQEDAAVEISEIIRDADADDPGQTAEDIQDAAGDAAEACDIDEFAEAPEETTTTTEEQETTTTTEEEPEDTTTTAGGGEEPAGDLNVIAPRQEVPADIEAAFAGLAETCFIGNVAACDDIFFGTDDAGTGAAPDGSVARAYGASCGGRIAEFVASQPSRCIENFFLATEPDLATFTDPSFAGLAQACFANDMQSCVDLFFQTGVGTPEEQYGETCGFRVDPTVTTTGNCLDVFGPTAFG